MVPPGEIDGAAEVGAISPVGNDGPADRMQAEEVTAYPSSDQPVAETSVNADYIDSPNLAARDNGKRLPKIDEEPVVETASLAPAEDGGINMDASLGVGTTGLAEEQAGEIAEVDPDQPLVDGIGTDQPVEVRKKLSRPAAEFNQAVTSDDITLPSRPGKVDEDGQQVAFIPRFSDPMQIPESYGGMSVADKTCRQQLKKLGVKFAELDPIRDGNNCGIAHPIELRGLAGGIDVRPAAKLNCQVTLAFAKWVKYELVPSSRYRYFSGVKTIRQMSSYSCRRMNSSRSNPWSEHAKGNAIDVGQFVLKNGKEIDVRKKSIFAFRERGLLKAVRSDSCKYFNTVLGPGSDRHHKDHFHFDLRTRKSGYRHCDL
jgi:hypothetical protein